MPKDAKEKKKVETLLIKWLRKLQCIQKWGNMQPIKNNYLQRILNDIGSYE